MFTNLKSPSPALVILPGLMCNSRMFVGQLAAFPGCHVVDGFYGGAQSLSDMAAFALRQLPDTFVLIGHSMGGRVALEILRQAPGRVAGLLLSNLGVHAVQPGEAEKRHRLRDIGREHGFSALIADWLPPMISPVRRSDTALMQNLTDMCMAAGQATYEAHINALLSRPELESVLPEINCPTLVVTGSDDQWAPPAQHQAIADAIAGAELSIIDGAGHMLPAEDPEAFNQAITRVLARLRG